nr:hypothetical protein [uncultured Rhodoferax sp.]
MGDYQFGIGVEPHKRWPVAWFNPFVLLQSARDLISSFNVLRNADPREQWSGVFHANDHAHELTPDGCFWFDFVSDTGDGGNATYTVARALLAEELTPSGFHAGGEAGFPRGQVLFLGGDLCYPSANALEYQYRFLEIFEGARATLGRDPSGRSAYAIPQNHDWLDSISTFKRYFVLRDNGEISGLRTPQARSYYATRLPHRWWVLGFDFALAGDIDRGQYEAFRCLAGDDVAGAECPVLRMHAGDQLILIYPEPYWTRPLGDSAPLGYPKRYQRLEAMLEAKGMHIRLRMAGDVHHYVRESATPWDASADDMLVTCGSGGAFLHPTHAKFLNQAKAKRQASDPYAISSELRTATLIGTVPALDTASAPYVAQCAYPDPVQSRALSKGCLTSLFKFAWNDCIPFGQQLLTGIRQGNVLLALLLGVVYSVALLGALMASPAPCRPEAYGGCALSSAWLRGVLASPVSLAAHGILLTWCWALAKEERQSFAKWGSTLLHFAAHALSLAGLYGVCGLVREALGPGGVYGALAWLGVMTASVLAGTLSAGLVSGLYLWAMGHAGYLWNNAFSPVACEDYKGFLRFRIDADGGLTGYFFGCDAVPRQWQRNRAAGGTTVGDARPAWTEAEGVPQADWRLVDSFRLDGRPPPH